MCTQEMMSVSVYYCFQCQMYFSGQLCYMLSFKFTHVGVPQLPELHRLMVEAAEILKTEAPDLYVRQSPVPNAYTLAISGKKPFVVVHTSLVELLTQKELQVFTLSLFHGHHHCF